jgi:multiple antibiotic resistance protein
MPVISAALLLVLVIDPLGNVPFFIVALRNVQPERQVRVIFREMCLALAVMLVFLFFGRYILQVLHISEPSLSIAGGIVLFLIALSMVFPIRRGLLSGEVEGEPLFVPMAVPLVAGPSAIATVMLLMTRDPSRWPEWLLAVAIAWLIALGVLLLSGRLKRFLGDRGLAACERLMGMILTIIAVQMLTNGIAAFVQSARPGPQPGLREGCVLPMSLPRATACSPHAARAAARSTSPSGAAACRQAAGSANACRRCSRAPVRSDPCGRSANLADGGIRLTQVATRDCGGVGARECA